MLQDKLVLSGNPECLIFAAEPFLKFIQSKSVLLMWSVIVVIYAIHQDDICKKTMICFSNTHLFSPCVHFFKNVLIFWFYKCDIEP